MPELKKAMDTLRYISQDEEVRMIEEMREKALLDYRSSINDAKRQGLEKGIKRGMAREKEENAQKMLLEGINLQLVSKITGLTEEELIKIQAQLPKMFEMKP